MKTIIFTGPESSGKSTLAKVVHDYFGGILVLEYAREYLEKLNRNYIQKDLLIIAKKQLEIQKEAIITNPEYAFFDTDLLTIKIWSNFKYSSCNEWINTKIKKQKNTIYILCKPDFEWVKDDLRENPNDRDELYLMYKKELEQLNFQYIEVEGTVKNRLEKIKKNV